MRNCTVGVTSFCAVFLLIVLTAGCPETQRSGGAFSAHDGTGTAMRPGDAGISTPAPLRILDPLDEALFPPDIAAPTIRWEDHAPSVSVWVVRFQFSDDRHPLEFQSGSPAWTPSDADWEAIKQRSLHGEARLTIRGFRQSDAGTALSEGSVTIRTSPDPVEAPLFFREVNLPFLKAVKDPAAHIRWRFGPVSSKEPPPIVLEKLPVCGNCHSFAHDGSTLALEVDSGNDKGGYAIAPIEKQIVLDPQKLITWSEYRREDGALTFGLLCQISPDGRHVAGTVKDRALAVYRPDLMYSQLFFLVKGILAIYDRQRKTFHPLPGADDPRFVQTNATWSPDGKWIVFARATAYEPQGLEHVRSVVVPPEAAEVFVKGERQFQYDLYRVAFNEGKGGKPEPIEGASHNGTSNYFPKFSPDGKWIVFCRAKSFMLLQPDSELYIIPATGGQARRLQCNTSRMNSWHSWSPNNKWLVFSSKLYSPYTQLFLTHIDEEGHSSVPVVLSRFTEPQRAANIPEFVNARPDAIQKIQEAFLDDLHYYRAGFAYIEQDDPAGAIPLFEKSLEINPRNTLSRLDLADALWELGRTADSRDQLVKILEIEPDHGLAHFRLAAILRDEGKLDEAVEHFRQALRKEPDLHEAYAALAMILLETGRPDESAQHFAEAVRTEPQKGLTNHYFGEVMYGKGKLKEAVRYYQRALEQNPDFVPALLNLAAVRAMINQPDLCNVEQALALTTKACEVTKYQNPDALKSLAGVYATAGRFGLAADTARKALELARSGENQDLTRRIERLLQTYQQLEAANRE